MPKPPVIFLAYAGYHSEKNHLAHIPLETSETKRVLEKAKEASLIELVVVENATLEKILNVFQHQDYKGRIAIFHFSGHADGFSLILEKPFQEKAILHAQKISNFLSTQSGLQLVFLNACATRVQAKMLIEKGIPAVIATNKNIPDNLARKVAVEFYRSLGAGSKLAIAWQEAKNLADNSDTSGKSRLLYRKDRSQGEKTPPWKIYYHPVHLDTANWSLTDAARMPLYGLPDRKGLIMPPDPYPKTGIYDETLAGIFWGRDFVIRDLYDLLTKGEEETQLVLLYGATGVGKTSLIQAGLIPYLKQEHLVSYLDHPDDISSAITKHSKEVKTSKSADKPMFLFIDNVQDEALKQIWPDIQSFLKQETNLMVIFSIRSISYTHWKAYLGNKLSWTNFYVPTLKDSDIQQVILGGPHQLLTKHYNAKVGDEFPVRLAHLFSNDDTSVIAPVLWYLMRHLWIEAFSRNSSQPNLNWELLEAINEAKENKNGTFWESYVNAQLHTISDFPRDFLLNILKDHLPLSNPNQTRNRVYFQEKYPDIPLEMVLERLSQQGLLCSPASEEASTDKPTRMIHQLTFIPLLRLINRSEAPGQKIPRLLEYHEQNQEFFNARQLRLIESYRAYLPKLSASKEHLIQESKAKITATKNRQRRNRFFRLVMITVIISVGYLFYNPFCLLYLLLLLLAYRGNRIV